MKNPFSPPADAEHIPEEEVASTYTYWRGRLLSSTFLGYVMYYLVRKNMSMALPQMEQSLGCHKSDLGKIISANEITYGFSKFFNGMAADVSNARYFMSFGLLMAGLANIAFGMSASLWTLGLFWMLNGWFQGMGFPPCARIMCHWFSLRERGIKWSRFATSQQVGAASALILSGFLVQHLGWRSVFILPGVIAVIGSLFLTNRLRDTPGSLGLPPVDEYMGDVAPRAKGHKEPVENFRELVLERVFKNRVIWIIALANFFVYVLRGSFLYWAPTYLSEAKHIPLQQAGWITAGFEGAGLVGALLAGWISDRLMKGKRSPVCVAFMLLSMVAVGLFSMVPAGHPVLSAVTLLLVGFSIYGPQFLVGVMMTDQSGKEAAATADGLAGLFGYASGIISGWGTGVIVQSMGWDITFRMMMLCSCLSAVLFCLCWNSRPRA